MTLGDFLRIVDVQKDKDKMILIDYGEGWGNCYATNNEHEPIYIKPSNNSPFLDGG